MTRPHTPVSKTVRTRPFSQTVNVMASTGADVLNSWGSMMFEDDVRIIGAEIYLEVLVNDAASNTDGYVNGSAEVSRVGLHSQPGCVVWVELQKVWNAAVSIGGGGNRKGEIVMFPEGYGIDVDAYEYMYINARVLETVCTSSISWYANGMVYYVER